MLNQRRSVRVGTLACVLMAWACGDASEPGSDESAEQWTLDPSPTLEVGEVEGAPEEVFSRISAVELLGDGGVAVGNGASGTIRVFDADGVFESEFGGEGEGPGEFSYLGDVKVVGGDTILAYDPVWPFDSPSLRVPGS